MANAGAEKQKIGEITDKLEQGLAELKKSGINLAGWSSGETITELRNALEAVRESSSELIMQMDGRIQEFSAMKHAEQYITQLEAEKMIFTDDERNLIVNYAYKMDDFEDAKELADLLVFQLENSPNLVAQTVISTQAEIDALPDGMIGLSEMHDYGYSWDEMLPLTKERARELFEREVEIYQLHVDGAETLIEDIEDIEAHGGIFGVEKSQWGLYQEREAHALVYFEERNMEPVDQLLLGEQDQYGIFQLKHNDENRDFRFMSHDFLQQHGMEIDRKNYDLVYTAPLTEGVTLDGIYEKFNIDRPEDFTGHSLSVSDVIVFHQNRENTSHYVDSFGFTGVPEFHKYPTVEEQIAVEETIDMLADNTEVQSEIISQQEIKQHSTSYYVIEDLATWANNSEERSALERFDNIDDAMKQFQTYRGQAWEYGDDSARTTFGVSIGGIEFDLIHVRNDENYLVQDFTQISVTKDNDQFLDDLQVLYNEIGFDKTRLHREMTPEEVKNFVKERFVHQLQSGGLSGISLYMERFNTLYEQGKMENLMPTASQRHIQEDIPFTDWENSYIGVNYKYADLADKELSVTEYLSLAGMPQAAVSVDGLMEMVNSAHTAFHFDMEDKEHCLQENIPVVIVRDGKEAAFFELPVGAIERARNTEFHGYEPEEMAVAIEDRFIGIQRIEDGYDYTIYDADYKELDGGVYDNPNITIQKALDEIVADLKESALNTETEQHTTLQGNVCVDSPVIPVDYEELSEKAELVAQREIADRISRQVEENRIVDNFRAKTREHFKNINGETPDDIENTVHAYVKSKIEEYDARASIVSVVVAGSRCRGLEQAGSDLDVIVEFAGSEREDDLFNLVHEDGLLIGGIKVDINPITEAKTGTLATYLPQVEEYLFINKV